MRTVTIYSQLWLVKFDDYHNFIELIWNRRKNVRHWRLSAWSINTNVCRKSIDKEKWLKIEFFFEGIAAKLLIRMTQFNHFLFNWWMRGIEWSFCCCCCGCCWRVDSAVSLSNLSSWKKKWKAPWENRRKTEEKKKREEELEKKEYGRGKIYLIRFLRALHINLRWFPTLITKQFQRIWRMWKSFNSLHRWLL